MPKSTNKSTSSSNDVGSVARSHKSKPSRSNGYPSLTNRVFQHPQPQSLMLLHAVDSKMLRSFPHLEKGLFPFNETPLTNLLYDKSRTRYTYLGFYGSFAAVPDRDLVTLRLVHKINGAPYRGIVDFEMKVERGMLILRFALRDPIGENYRFELGVVGFGTGSVDAPKASHSNRSKKSSVPINPPPIVQQQQVPALSAPFQPQQAVEPSNSDFFGMQHQHQHQQSSDIPFTSNQPSPHGSVPSDADLPVDLLLDPDLINSPFHIFNSGSISPSDILFNDANNTSDDHPSPVPDFSYIWSHPLPETPTQQ